MKLDRGIAQLAAVIAVLAMGCGRASAPKQPSAVTTTSVSTTQVTAAELNRSADAPKVGKPQQHVDAAVLDEEAGKKDEPQRHGERKPGGGFSGYK